MWHFSHTSLIAEQNCGHDGLCQDNKYPHYQEPYHATHCLIEDTNDLPLVFKEVILEVQPHYSDELRTSQQLID
jgi:hypothetical protein